MPSVSVPLHITTKISSDLLDFDANNPRLIELSSAQGADRETIRALADMADLSEIVQSISTNGYIDIEPLIVMENADRFTVLEGNRRLAAIKLLKEPALAAATNIAVPSVDAAVLASCASISVYRVANPQEAREYIGFKHINGPHKWDALAKARFSADWYITGRANGLSVKDVAKRLGDSNDTVLRLITGMFVLDQATEARVFDMSDRYPDRSFAFSHLYTALTRPGYREFLGLPSEWRASVPEPSPVPSANMENLRLVMRWLYGSKEDKVPPVIRSQNPHIKQLGAVLQNPVARAVMLENHNLRDAYREVELPSDRFEASLVKSVQNSELALSQIGSADASDESIVSLSERLQKTATVIHKTLLAAIPEDEE